jgi:hypothetical protein
MSAINQDPPLDVPGNVIGWVVKDHEGRLIFCEKRTVLSFFDNPPRPVVYGDTLRTHAQTGLTDEGWMIDLASKGELAAYDQGCNQMMAALRKILDGKDDGKGVCNEPWEGLRRRVLALQHIAAGARVLCERVIEAGKTLKEEPKPEFMATPRPQRRSKP